MNGFPFNRIQKTTGNETCDDNEHTKSEKYVLCRLTLISPLLIHWCAVKIVCFDRSSL